MDAGNARLRAALDLWDLPRDSDVRLINHSENHTFAIAAPDGRRFALRLHRTGYQSVRSIESELAWLAAIARDTDLPVPHAVPGVDGRALQFAGDRAAVLFAHIEGAEPTLGDDLVPIFETLGRYAALLHRHAEHWTRPEGFERFVWSAEAVLDPMGLWGDWRAAPEVAGPVRGVLDRLDGALRDALAAYGTGSDRFGLIHADMRLGNLLVAGERVSVIDFDDCGFCWFAYDFAAAVSFHETEPAVPALKEAWLRGYLPVRPLAGADIAAMDAMVLLRRMALTAWIGSHAETDLARTHRPGFAEGTAMLADRFLSANRIA